MTLMTKSESVCWCVFMFGCVSLALCLFLLQFWLKKQGGCSLRCGRGGHLLSNCAPSHSPQSSHQLPARLSKFVEGVITFVLWNLLSASGGSF